MSVKDQWVGCVGVNYVTRNLALSVLAGRDLIAGANTGSGKTVAFALPLLQQLGPHLHTDKPLSSKSSKGNYVTGLILVPTRELAKQVADSIKSYLITTINKHHELYLN